MLTNMTSSELTEFIDICITEQLNDWLADCTPEDIAVMLCMARMRKLLPSSTITDCA